MEGGVAGSATGGGVGGGGAATPGDETGGGEDGTTTAGGAGVVGTRTVGGGARPPVKEGGGVETDPGSTPGEMTVPPGTTTRVGSTACSSWRGVGLPPRPASSAAAACATGQDQVSECQSQWIQGIWRMSIEAGRRSSKGLAAAAAAAAAGGNGGGVCQGACCPSCLPRDLRAVLSIGKDAASPRRPKRSRAART